MSVDPDALARELALLSQLHAGCDPLMASLRVAIYLEDAEGVRLTDAQIEAGLLDSATVGDLHRGIGPAA